MKDYTAPYLSPLGPMTMASNGKSLIGLWFDGQKAFAEVLMSENETNPDLPIFRETRRWLDAYFCGRSPGFTPPLLLRGSTFRRRVWEMLLTIPFGQTMTYGEVARRVGCRSAQAVGGAVGHNPVSLIIPCHRVVGADGSLTGYAGGIGRKTRLLRLEHEKNGIRL